MVAEVNPTLRAGLRVLLWLAACLSMVAGCQALDPPTLCVRVGSGFSYRIEQSVGEEQLSVLARSASTEDAWLFARGTWIDVGYEETARSVLVNARAAVDAVRDYMRPGILIAWGQAAPLVFYHIHPFHQDARIVEAPGLQDVHSLALLKEQCEQTLGTGIIGLLFDGRGKWTFDITHNLQSRIHHDEYLGGSGSGGTIGYTVSHGYVVRPDSASLFDLQYPLAVWSAALVDSTASREKRISEYIKAARQMGVLATYTPGLSSRRL
jgi:hypothetical protein